MKRQFVEKIKESNYSIISDVSDLVKGYPPDKLKKLNQLSGVFTNLKKYLSNQHVFSSPHLYKGEGICNYISYLLYDGIRKENNGQCDNQTFNDFKDFVDRYSENTGSRICKYMLKYMKYTDYQKWVALYNLYDKYTEIPQASTETYIKYCSSMHNLVYEYNQFLKDYPSDSSEFDDVLTKFEKLMKAITQAAEKNCTRQYFTINEPSLFKRIEEKIPPTPKTLSGPESNLPQRGPLDNESKPNPPELTSTSTMLGGEQLRDDLGNLQSSQVSNTLEVAPASESREFVGKRPPHHNLGHSEQLVSFTPQETYESRRNYGLRGPYEQERYIETNETYPPEDNSILVTKQLGLGSEKEHGGVMTDMKNAFSGFMNSVDPVPVVGVSGGIGALFLLFRVLKVLKIYPCFYSIFKQKYTFHIITL
ncbi:hypothetical protein PVBG_03688 [Plasmodium vivax Brazil I]|uniref:Uncharacterized protein n=1 Tax=Plasmodium vivax (strain Brazil I) TaxID=1033975 RepID=A0A0J9VPZ6_PLAV1|nr:hypothetical protein PVBG_03688 [Plasmodium vivax Brazil I]